MFQSIRKTGLQFLCLVKRNKKKEEIKRKKKSGDGVEGKRTEWDNQNYEDAINYFLSIPTNLFR
jgi:hypothetical protein